MRRDKVRLVEFPAKSLGSFSTDYWTLSGLRWRRKGSYNVSMSDSPAQHMKCMEVRGQPTDDPGRRLRRAGRLGLQQAAWRGAARPRRLLRFELRGRPYQPLAAGRRLRARNVGGLHRRRSPNTDAAICQSLGSGGVRAFAESTILCPVKNGTFATAIVSTFFAPSEG